jgi:DNA-binding NtrC family response regulator
MGTLLIVDRDDSLRSDVARYFHSLGHGVHQAVGFAAARELAGRLAFDVIISEAVLEQGGVLELLRAARELNPDTALIAEAEPQAVEQGVEALRGGAFSLLAKPYSLPELNFQVKRALEGRSRRASPGLVERYQNVYRPYSFIGECPEIKQVFQMVERVARTDSSVIIVGETGTGKELVAGAIHYNSPRADGPFVRVNCAALPEQLLESELFGHQKGAFTGADRLRIGRFEHADGGTLFLDEVADMSLFTQAKVLRVLQEKEFERLGSNEPVQTDVRILSATNRDLAELRARGEFRQDLYYRLNVVTIRLPPLRERGGDIGLLAQFFLKKYSAQMDKRIRGIAPEAMRQLARHPWPGNIRELENTLERAVLMADGEEVTAGDLALFLPADGPSGDRPAAGDAAAAAGPPTLGQAERRLLLEALEDSGWVQKEAARRLGLSGRALNYRIRKLGITHPGWRRNKE